MKLSKLIQQLQATYVASGDIEVAGIEGGPTLDPLQVTLDKRHLVIIAEVNAESPHGMEAPYLLIGAPNN